MPAEGLALTRDLLGADTRVSRGANAVQLTREGRVSVRVRVPGGALVRPLVIEDTTLVSLQSDVPPSTAEWRVSPGRLGEPWITATANGSALALLRAAVWDEKSELMHLVRLPRPALVEPGNEASFVLPVTIAIAGAALDITTALTAAPAASPGTCVASFDVVPLRHSLGSPEPLEQLAATPAAEAIWIPGVDHVLDWQSAERAVAAGAPPGASWFLLPALTEDGGELVLLAFRDKAGRWHLAGTGRDPASWIAELASRVAGEVRCSSALPHLPDRAAPGAVAARARHARTLRRLHHLRRRRRPTRVGSSARPRRPRSRCCCSARAAPARSCSPLRCTNTPGAGARSSP